MAARRLRVYITAAAFLGLLTGTATPETIVHKSISYFQISGTTAEDLDRELGRNGPKTKSTGSRHPGATRIRFGGDVTYVESDNRCAVSKAKVTLKTQLILPKWKNRNRAGKDLALIWDSLSSDIKRHEERHAEIARQYARKLEKTVKSLRPQRDCLAMEARVAEATDRIIEAHDKDQMRFDRVEAANFEKRMIRILDYRSKRVP
ncbi:MAG TPA: peptidase [Rhizobium sp.]|nr:peptidase [Rhizobium sp.]